MYMKCVLAAENM